MSLLILQMYRIDALYATSKRQAVAKLDKYIKHVAEEEGVQLYIVELRYRGDNVWIYTLGTDFPDKSYLLWWNAHYNGRNTRNKNLW